VTVRVTRSFDVDAPPEQVWDFRSDPAQRASAISVVERYETTDDGAVWHVRVPVPLVDRTVSVRTRDVERDPPRYVKFVGRSKAFRVTGEHRISARDGGSTVENTFVVDGRVPGVERFFRRQLDAELTSLEERLRSTTG
jgi:carbon monoxide dehydrogenase subunit G